MNTPNRAVVIELAGPQLPGLTKEFLEIVIEKANSLVMEKVSGECEACDGVEACKAGALEVKAAAVKLIAGIEEYEATVVEQSKKAGCK